MYAYVNRKRQMLPGGFAPFLDRGRTAVVSIDLHRGHLEDSPDCPCPAPRAREIVGPVDAFHDEARALGVPVIHVRSTLRRGGVDDVNGLKAAWRLVFPLHVGDIRNADEHAMEGTRWNEFVTRVAPDDLVVSTKKRLTAFYPSDLDFLLRNLGVATVVLNGCLTDCCVLNSAFDAANLGYNVIVLQDLCRGTNAALEEAALSIVAMHTAVVADSSDLLAEWSAAPVVRAARG
jgi:nicotinamidase-related amidase